MSPTLMGRGLPVSDIRVLLVIEWTTAAQRYDQVPEEDHNRYTKNERAYRLQQIHLIPAKIVGIGIDSPRHPQQAKNMHGEERHIHSYQRQPELHLSEPLVH